MNKTRLFSISIIFVLPSPIFAQIPPIIVGANLNAYQQPTGSDCNINVPSQYSTIQAAINASSNADTVCVGAGTYFGCQT